MSVTAAWLAVGAVLVYGAVIYHRLVTDRNRVHTGWSDIHVQLKRRHDLVPKLVECVHQYAADEQATLEALTQVRASSEAARGLRATEDAENALSSSVRRLFALVEGYPALKADTVFLDLQKAITQVEDDIQLSRRYYNGAVRALNTRIERFPDLLVARALSLDPAQYFELDDDIAGTPGHRSR